MVQFIRIQPNGLRADITVCEDGLVWRSPVDQLPVPQLATECPAALYEEAEALCSAAEAKKKAAQAKEKAFKQQLQSGDIYGVRTASDEAGDSPDFDEEAPPYISNFGLEGEPLTSEELERRERLWKASAKALLPYMSPDGQQQALAEWAKLNFKPTLPAPPMTARRPELSWGVVSDITVLDLEFQAPADLLELAAARYVNGELVGEYVSFVRHHGPINSRVTQLTGISLADVYNAPEAKEVLQHFRQLCGDSVLVCHNITADRRVLEATRTKLGAEKPMPNRWLCTLALARKRLPKGTECGLGKLCTAFGISAAGAHHARRDVQMCFEVLRHLHLQQPITELITSAAQPAGGTGSLFAAAA